MLGYRRRWLFVEGRRYGGGGRHLGFEPVIPRFPGPTACCARRRSRRRSHVRKGGLLLLTKPQKMGLGLRLRK